MVVKENGPQTCYICDTPNLPPAQESVPKNKGTPPKKKLCMANAALESHKLLRMVYLRPRQSMENNVIWCAH